MPAGHVPAGSLIQLQAVIGNTGSSAVSLEPLGATVAAGYRIGLLDGHGRSRARAGAERHAGARSRRQYGDDQRVAARRRARRVYLRRLGHVRPADHLSGREVQGGLCGPCPAAAAVAAAASQEIAPTETPTPAPTGSGSFEQRLVDLINVIRVERALPALPRQRQSARPRRAGLPATWPASTMPRRPTSTGWDAPWRTRLAALGYSPSLSVAENVAWGQASPEAVVARWMNSPADRANILNRQLLRDRGRPRLRCGQRLGALLGRRLRLPASDAHGDAHADADAHAHADGHGHAHADGDSRRARPRPRPTTTRTPTVTPTRTATVGRRLADDLQRQLRGRFPRSLAGAGLSDLGSHRLPGLRRRVQRLAGGQRHDALRRQLSRQSECLAGLRAVRLERRHGSRSHLPAAIRAPQQGLDYFKWLVSVDSGFHYYGWRSSGSSNGWVSTTFDLTNVPTLGDLRWQSAVWLAFVLSSDAAGTDYGRLRRQHRDSQADRLRAGSREAHRRPRRVDRPVAGSRGAAMTAPTEWPAGRSGESRSCVR